jgi:glycerol transport system ATP-binding protein
VPPALAALPDGPYTAGFRPNHVELARHVPDAMRFETRLSVTEITGSETFVHLDHHGEPWVGLVHGVRSLRAGEPIEVFLDPAHVYLFAEDGTLVSVAPYAEAA